MSALRDIPFQELLNQTAEHCGLDSERLGMSEGRGIATFLTTAAREMLRENDWPGSIVTEARFIEAGALFVAGTTEYDYGDVVRETIDGESSFWQCIIPIGEVSDQMNPVTVGVVTGESTNEFSFTTATITNTPAIGDILYSATAETATVIAVYESGPSTLVRTATDLTAAIVGSTVSRSPRPSETPELWEAYTGELRISYEQTGETPMLDVLAVYESDPAITDSPAQCSYTLDETGILFDVGNAADVWVRFRKCPPRFSVALYSAARAYAIGDLAVVWPHCYYCIQAGTNHAPASSPTYWQPQTLPEKVSESVCLDAAIRWLRSTGNFAQANALKSDREDALDRASRVRNRQEGQTRTYAVATRNNAPANNYRPRRAALR